MTAQEKTTFNKVIETLKVEMEKWNIGKLTGQLQIELNYSCGGLSKVYVISKNALK